MYTRTKQFFIALSICTSAVSSDLTIDLSPVLLDTKAADLECDTPRAEACLTAVQNLAEEYSRAHVTRLVSLQELEAKKRVYAVTKKLEQLGHWSEQRVLRALLDEELTTAENRQKITRKLRRAQLFKQDPMSLCAVIDKQIENVQKKLEELDVQTLQPEQTEQKKPDRVLRVTTYHLPPITDNASTNGLLKAYRSKCPQAPGVRRFKPKTPRNYHGSTSGNWRRLTDWGNQG